MKTIPHQFFLFIDHSGYQIPLRRLRQLPCFIRVGQSITFDDYDGFVVKSADYEIDENRVDVIFDYDFSGWTWDDVISFIEDRLAARWESDGRIYTPEVNEVLINDLIDRHRGCLHSLPTDEIDLYDLAIDGRYVTALNGEGIRRVDHLTTWPVDTLMQIKGIGDLGIAQIRSALNSRGLKLRCDTTFAKDPA